MRPSAAGLHDLEEEEERVAASKVSKNLQSDGV
jgi:hypothetical protein